MRMPLRSRKGMHRAGGHHRPSRLPRKRVNRLTAWGSSVRLVQSTRSCAPHHSLASRRLALPAVGVHAHIVTAKHSGPNGSPRASDSLPYAASVLDIGDAQSIAAFSASGLGNAIVASHPISWHEGPAHGQQAEKGSSRMPSSTAGPRQRVTNSDRGAYFRQAMASWGTKWGPVILRLC